MHISCCAKQQEWLCHIPQIFQNHFHQGGHPEPNYGNDTSSWMQQMTGLIAVQRLFFHKPYSLTTW